ncbi:MAG TPA: type II CAAX endopeptidase family protein [Polyangiaceae bacterium]|nr:type II CAAX endopeptidase family protein [Polyangiaceae bacterium]
MPTDADAPPAPPAPVDRDGSLSFFVVALGMTWGLQLPAVLAKWGVLPGGVERFMLPAALGGFGPLVAAIVASRRAGARGGPGTRELFRSLGDWRVGPHWVAIALLGFTAIYVTGHAAYRLFGGADAGQWLYPPETAQHVVAMVLMPLVEEPGWRGFALPRLQRRYGVLPASGLLGALWALWHTTMFILQGAAPVDFAVAMLNIFAGSVVFSWLYNRTKGSLLLAVVAHAGAHLNNPTHALPAHPTPFVIYTAAICVAAGALVLLDRGVFGRGGAAQANMQGA